MQQAEQQLRQAEKLRQSARFDEAIACIESLAKPIRTWPRRTTTWA